MVQRNITEKIADGRMLTIYGQHLLPTFRHHHHRHCHIIITIDIAYMSPPSLLLSSEEMVFLNSMVQLMYFGVRVTLFFGAVAVLVGLNQCDWSMKYGDIVVIVISFSAVVLIARSIFKCDSRELDLE